jgi:hypothetical protein
MWRFPHTACTVTSPDTALMSGWVRELFDFDELAGSRNFDLTDFSVGHHASNLDDVFAAD